MRRSRLAFVPLAALAGLAFSTAAGAQSSRTLSLQLSGLGVGVFGSAYDGLKGGPGFEAQLRYNPSAFSIGGGVQISNHDFDFQELSGQSVKLAGAFVEPRYVIDVQSQRLAPYISARLAYLRQTLEMDEIGLTAHASGTQINGGGGILVRMSSLVNLDIGMTYGMIHFGDIEVEESPVGSGTITGSSGNGQNLVFRVGVAIGLGR